MIRNWSFTRDGRNKIIFQYVFNTLHMILHSWNSVVEELVLRCIWRSHVYIQNKLLEVVFQQFLITVMLIPQLTVHFQQWHLTCLCPDDAILMLVLLNVSAAFNSYWGSKIILTCLVFNHVSALVKSSAKLPY